MFPWVDRAGMVFPHIPREKAMTALLAVERHHTDQPRRVLPRRLRTRSEHYTVPAPWTRNLTAHDGLELPPRISGLPRSHNRTIKTFPLQSS